MSFHFDKLPIDDAAVIQKHSRSFSLAAKLLPAHVRGDVEKLYAWCRWCDDAVDEAPDKKAARARLELLRADVRLIYAGESPLHPASKWLASLVHQYNIPIDLPLDLLSGMETDLDDPVLETVEELMLYCYQAAGTVGLMMCRVMGVTDSQAFSKAKALGMAMQLTNIARDVREDWQTGRRYIPKKWLALVPGKDMTPSNREVRPAVRELLKLADELYVEGNSGLRYLPDGVRFAIRLAGKVYREIGEEIRRRDLAVMSGRIFVPLTQKLWLIGNCAVAETSFRTDRMVRQVTQHFIQSNLTQNSFSRGPAVMKNDNLYLFYFGISLTLVMATTMFVLVGINPKQTAYESLPWIYSAVCAVMATVTGLMARRYNSLLEPEPTKAKPE